MCVCACRTLSRRFRVFGWICFLFGVCGTLFASIARNSALAQLQQNVASYSLIDSESASAYASWVSSESSQAYPAYADFYVFNVTNADEIIAGGATRPTLAEIGPIRLATNQQKLGVQWPDDYAGDRVSYTQYLYYTPADDVSAQLLLQTITSLNVPLVRSVQGSENVATLIASDPQLAAWTDPAALFISNRTIADVLFGWEDPYLQVISNSIAGFPSTYRGLFGGNDSSPDAALAQHGTNLIFTGADSPALARYFSGYDGMDEMECCTYGPCGEADAGGGASLPWNGVDATAFSGAGDVGQMQFPPGTGLAAASSSGVGSDLGGDSGTGAIDDDSHADTILATYQWGAYRHWTMEVNKHSPTYTYNDVELVLFNINTGSWGNTTVDADQAEAYNTFGPSGTLNQSTCGAGAQLYLSQPHFLGGSNSLKNGVAGLTPPTQSAHGSYFGIEPHTGRSLDWHWRMQANLLLHAVNASLTVRVDDGAFTFFPSIQAPVYFPIAWVDLWSQADAAAAAQLRTDVYTWQTIILACKWGGIALAVVGFVAWILLLYAANWARKRQKTKNWTQHALQPVSINVLPGRNAYVSANSNEGRSGSVWSSVVSAVTPRSLQRAGSRAGGRGGGGQRLLHDFDVDIMQQPAAGHANHGQYDYDAYGQLRGSVDLDAAYSDMG